MREETRAIMASTMEHIKRLSEKLTQHQERQIEKAVDRLEKKFNKRVDECVKKLSSGAIEDIKNRLEIVKDVESIHSKIRDLHHLSESLIEKHAFLTEVSYLGSIRLNKLDQAKLNEELIKSMNYDFNWFKKRNELSLNELFEIYKNGVHPDAETE